MTRDSKKIDQKTREEIVKARKEAVRYFSSQNKEKRELWVANEFLVNLGIKFKDNELEPSKYDPPDVIFRGLNLEIKEIMDEGRKRHAELKEEVELAKTAETYDELFSQLTPKDITYKESQDLVIDCASKLAASKYPFGVRAKLDLLFYINLEEVYGYISTQLPTPKVLIDQGWRSVSAIIGTSSVVFMCSSHAPNWLMEYEGRVIKRTGVVE